MTNNVMISVLAQAELDAVTGGTLSRSARVITKTGVSQGAEGGFVGDFTITYNHAGPTLSNVGNTTNSSTVVVVGVAVA